MSPTWVRKISRKLLSWSVREVHIFFVFTNDIMLATFTRPLIYMFPSIVPIFKDWINQKDSTIYQRHHWTYFETNFLFFHWWPLVYIFLELGIISLMYNGKVYINLPFHCHYDAIVIIFTVYVATSIWSINRLSPLFLFSSIKRCRLLRVDDLF